MNQNVLVCVIRRYTFAVKIIYFIKLYPWQPLFSILCDDMGHRHKVLLLHTKVWWLSQGKSHVGMLRVTTWGSYFFHGIHFYLKEQTIIQSGYLANIFSKMNKVRLLLQDKQLAVSLPMIKVELSLKIRIMEKKLELWKICHLQLASQ